MALPTIQGTKVRGGTYHFNLRIPAALQAQYGGKTHLRGTIKTADPKAAARAVVVQKARFIEEAKDAERRADIGALVEGLRPDQRQLFDEAGGTLEGLLAEFERSKHAMAFAAIGEDDYSSDMPEAPRELRMEEARDRAALRVLQAEAVQEGKVLNALGEGVKVPGAATGLEDLAQEFFKAKGTEDQTRAAYLHTVRRFIELHGDIALEDLSTAHLREYANAVTGLPAVTSSKELRGLPFKDAVKVAKAKGLATISDQTRQRHISMLKALTAFAVPQGFMASDPWAQFQLVRAKAKHSANGKTRAPFTPADARRILAEAAKHDPATIDRWAPLLACYQGARREEIGQLRGCDVFEEDGVWCMRVTDEGEGQKIKNAASLRTIPLHPKVIKAGFDKFARGRADEPFLFQEAARWGRKLSPMKPDARGRVTEAYGKRFARMIREKLEIKDSKLVFHSFRHLWEDAAEDCEIPQTHRRDLAGRSSKGDSQAAYGDGPKLGALAQSLAKIDPLAD